MQRKYEITNQLVHELNQAIINKNESQALELLGQFNEDNINLYDLNDLLDKKRPIDCVVETGSIKILKAILAKKPALNEPCESTGSYPIHRAVRSLEGEELREVLFYLNSLKPDFTKKEKVTGFTVLHLFIYQNKVDDLERFLKEENINEIINETDTQYRTPLKFAIEQFGRNHLLVQLIEQKGGRLCSDDTSKLHDQMNVKANQTFPSLPNAESEFLLGLENKLISRARTLLEEGDRLMEEIESNRRKAVEEAHSINPGEKEVNTSDSLTKFSLHGRPIAKDPLITSFGKIIFDSKAPGPMHQALLNNLRRKDNPGAIIDAIVKECHKKVKTAQKPSFYDEKITILTQMKEDLTPALTSKKELA